MINQFSKKINIILYLIVILSLSVCTFLIIKAPDLLFIMQNILENKVFHRTFSLEKWAETINSLIAFPVFFVVIPTHYSFVFHINEDILLTGNQLTRIRHQLIHYLLCCCMCGAGEQAQAERKDSKSHSCKWILLDSQFHLPFYLII